MVRVEAAADLVHDSVADREWRELDLVVARPIASSVADLEDPRIASRAERQEDHSNDHRSEDRAEVEEGVRATSSSRAAAAWARARRRVQMRERAGASTSWPSRRTRPSLIPFRSSRCSPGKHGWLLPETFASSSQRARERPRGAAFRRTRADLLQNQLQ
jgi:hypothetical protein